MTREPVTISIGVFAHNEEKNILRTLASLADQDIFHKNGLEACASVWIIANGCIDKTVEISRHYLEKNDFLYGHVMEIDIAGKSNAWNSYIHSTEQSDADYFVCMDSDIQFGSCDVISSLLEALMGRDEAYLSIDLAKKDTEIKKNKSLFEHISLFFSSLMKQGSTAVAGSLYCARGEKLRGISMPIGLPVEDGFLRAMLVTDLFTQKDNNSRILVVNNVCHYFTPDSSIKALLKHEERLLIGTFINSVIYRYLWAEVAARGTDAGQLIRKNNLCNPSWVEELISQYRESHNPLIPGHFYTKYWKKWKKLTLWQQILSSPIILVASSIRYALLKKIERRLQTESGLGTW